MGKEKSATSKNVANQIARLAAKRMTPGGDNINQTLARTYAYYKTEAKNSGRSLADTIRTARNKSKPVGKRYSDDLKAIFHQGDGDGSFKNKVDSVMSL